MKSWLVVELGGDLDAYTCHARWGERSVQVSAEDTVAAAKVAMGLWGRPGRYAVVECAFEDLTVPDGVDGGLIDDVIGQAHR